MKSIVLVVLTLVSVISAGEISRRMPVKQEIDLESYEEEELQEFRQEINEDDEIEYEPKQIFNGCDFSVTPLLSCYDCRMPQKCLPNGKLIVYTCKSPVKPYCYNGICSAIPSQDCTTVKELETTSEEDSEQNSPEIIPLRHQRDSEIDEGDDNKIDEDEDSEVDTKQVFAQCDFLATPFLSCHDCRTPMKCLPNGKLKAWYCMSPMKPYCNNGICSAIPSEECAASEVSEEDGSGDSEIILL